MSKAGMVLLPHAAKTPELKSEIPTRSPHAATLSPRPRLGGGRTPWACPGGIAQRAEPKAPQAAIDVKSRLTLHLNLLKGEGGAAYLDTKWQEIYRDVVAADKCAELYHSKFEVIDRVGELCEDGSDVTDLLSNRRLGFVREKLASGKLVPRHKGLPVLANVAQQLAGCFQWSGAGTVRAFSPWLKEPAPLAKDAKLNCFEAVLYVAVLSRTVKKERVVKLYDSYAEKNGNELGDAILDLFGEGMPLYELLASGDAPAPGDVLVFRDVETHVALSLGGNDVMSLWNQPKNTKTYQETTLSELLEWFDACEVIVFCNPFS